MFNESKCRFGFLHRFILSKTYRDGVLEGCIICRKRVFFKNNGSNINYLRYHMRSGLQPSNKRFIKEYKVDYQSEFK